MDRWDRRRTLLVTHLLEVACLLPLLAVHTVDAIWLIDDHRAAGFARPVRHAG